MILSNGKNQTRRLLGTIDGILFQLLSISRRMFALIIVTFI
jgi:hypothetical protein